ncbi:MAG: hypothetical protein QOE54_6897 [Streptosporangiaceae bacterium]|jgi:hypothetical protein|nr:hypothetical protein [Streptosporangiaceae bacterium]MDX6434531.1 hypothetical protein [Streptosporangiaceae bacterium]
MYDPYNQGGYQQQPPNYYGPGGPVYQARTNGLAITAMIMGILGFLTCGVTSVLALIFGHIASGQIKRTGENGQGMALTGIILGWILTGLWILYWVLALAGVIASFGTSVGQSSNGY